MGRRKGDGKGRGTELRGLGVVGGHGLTGLAVLGELNISILGNEKRINTPKEVIEKDADLDHREETNGADVADGRMLRVHLGLKTSTYKTHIVTHSLFCIKRKKMVK